MKGLHYLLLKTLIMILVVHGKVLHIQFSLKIQKGVNLIATPSCYLLDGKFFLQMVAIGMDYLLVQKN